MNLTFITLEDNRECILLDEFKYKNDTYVILINSLDKEDYIIRKIVNNELIGLDNEEHFQKVFSHYFNSRMKV